jgi:hypothetical protein
MAGPPRSGGGATGLFEQNFLLVQHSPSLPTAAFTYAFWVFRGHHPQEGVSETWCPLVSKGSTGTGAAPSILVAPLTGQVKLAVATGHSEEEVLSRARLPKNKWVHVAAVFDEANRMQLFFDGMPDASVVAGGPAVPNELPLYVGGDPWTPSCFQKVALDDVKAYSRPLSYAEVRAEAAFAAGGDFVTLGCLECVAAEARCEAGYHLCSGLELHTGALQVAARLGWWKTGTGVWSSADAHAAVESKSSATRLGLCCEDEEDGAALVQH